MHVLILVILLFSGLCTAQTTSREEEVSYDYEATERKCAQKFGLTSDFVETNFKKDFKDDLDEKFKCFVACTYEKVIKLKDDGSLDIEKTNLIIDKELQGSDRNAAIKAVQACSNIKGDNNECDTIFKIVGCVLKNLK